MEGEEKEDDLKFLNLSRNNNEEYEVTNYSMLVISQKYKYLSTYKYNSFESHRHQMSTKGAWLQPVKSSNKIDVVADIMTSNIFTNSYVCDEIKMKYNMVYHSIGNIIPIPEGANYGGRKGSDNYYLKLKYMKELFDRMNKKESILLDEEKKFVEDRFEKNEIREGLTLSSRARRVNGKDYNALTNKLILRYWVKEELEELKINNWKEYVNCNHLKGNFVNDDYCIEEFDYNTINEDSVIWIIKCIIKRSFQILGEYPNKKRIDDVYNKL